VKDEPALPEIPDGMGVKKRRDEAVEAAFDAEERVAAGVKARDEAVRKEAEHELKAASLPSEQWTAEARDLGGKRRAAERYLALAQQKRDQTFEDLVSAEIELAKQGQHTDCRHRNEIVLKLGPALETVEALFRDLNASVLDKSLRSTQRDLEIQMISSVMVRATGHAASPVPNIEPREFAAKMIAVPNDMMQKRVADNTREAMRGHWLNCRESDPARYRRERGRRKLGGKAGAEPEEPEPVEAELEEAGQS